MYASRTTQLIVGVFALLGIAALALLSLRVGRYELFEKPQYRIYSNFDNISGLKKGDTIEIAGVKVGKVHSIDLKNDRAKVELLINDGVQVDDEAVAAIRTRGIIGQKYVGISPGAGDRYLKDGDTLRQTESAFVLEDAIGQLLNNVGGGKGYSGEKNSPPPPSGQASSPPAPGGSKPVAQKPPEKPAEKPADDLQLM